MILSPLSIIDVAVFVVLLAWQLLVQVGLYTTITSAIHAVISISLPLSIQTVRERYLTPKSLRPLFVRQSTLAEYVAIRFVHRAFKALPARVLRVALDKAVGRPFFRWRMFRNGYLKNPVHCTEVTYDEGGVKTEGLWIKHDTSKAPDVVVYYIHGGGFALGSAAFYLEFLLAFHALLLQAGFKNPTVFGLEYSLVPDQAHPTQINEVLLGYQKVLQEVDDASKICVAGDSAGGTLTLSLLLELAGQGMPRQAGSAPSEAGRKAANLSRPRVAALLSPWVTLISNLHSLSGVDYLDRHMLWKYAYAYAGAELVHQAPVSPGSASDAKLWRAACPERGYVVTYGGEEVLAADIENFIKLQAMSGAEISTFVDEGGVHVWPVATMYLSGNNERRLGGLQSITREIRKRFI